MVQRVTSIIDSDGHTIADWKGMMKFTPEACAKTIGAPPLSNPFPPLDHRLLWARHANV